MPMTTAGSAGPQRAARRSLGPSLGAGLPCAAVAAVAPVRWPPVRAPRACTMAGGARWIMPWLRR